MKGSSKGLFVGLATGLTATGLYFFVLNPAHQSAALPCILFAMASSGSLGFAGGWLSDRRKAREEEAKNQAVPSNEQESPLPPPWPIPPESGESTE